MKNNEFLILTFLIILAVLPIAYGFYYIDQYGVNIPLDDQWDSIVPWTVQYYEGTFDPTILIANQNDSRSFFPFLIMMGISVVTRMDIKIIFYAGFLLYVCFIVFVTSLLFRDLNIQKKYFLLFLLPVFYYAFNPYYLFRFIYNVGSLGALVVIFALLTIYFIDLSKNQESQNKTHLFFGLSLLFGVMCSFSGAPGLTIWFAGLFQFSLQKTNEKIKKIFLWIIGAVILFYTYYIGLKFNTYGINNVHGSAAYSTYLLTAIIYPLNKFFCFMGVLGSEVIHDADIALFFGIILTGIFILLLYTNRNSLQLDKYSKWYALLVFGSLIGLELTLTRSGAIGISNFGDPETIFFIPAIRHTLDIFLPIMCIYFLALIYAKNSIDEPGIQDKKNSPILCKMSLNMITLGMIFTLMVCGALLHVIPGITAASQSYDNNMYSKYYLLNYNSVSDNNLKYLYPVPEIIKEYAPKLEQLKLGVFANHMNRNSILKMVNLNPDNKSDSRGNNLQAAYFMKSSNTTIGKSTMPAIFEHPQNQGSILMYNNYMILNNSHFEFYIGIDENTWDKSSSDGATFEISIAKNATPTEETILFSKSVNPANNYEDRSWKYQSIDLNNFSGQLVNIKLITRPNNNTANDWAWWGDPKIISSD